ncbi:MAG TPA: VOC family protein [Myxococcaceae bacterium]
MLGKETLEQGNRRLTVALVRTESGSKAVDGSRLFVRTLLRDADGKLVESQLEDMEAHDGEMSGCEASVRRKGAALALRTECTSVVNYPFCQPLVRLPGACGRVHVDGGEAQAGLLPQDADSSDARFRLNRLAGTVDRGWRPPARGIHGSPTFSLSLPRGEQGRMRGSESTQAKGREMSTQVLPFLMFTGQAEEAMKLYVSLIPGSEIININRYGPGGPGPEGSVMTAVFSVAGQQVMCSDSFVKHAFTFTPSFSFFINCDSEADVDRLSASLSQGGATLMPLGNYGFSRKFAWVNDRYGVSWQLNLP